MRIANDHVELSLPSPPFTQEPVPCHHIRLLQKLRLINDAKYAITEAYEDAAAQGEYVEERRRKRIAAASEYLKRRVESEL